MVGSRSPQRAGALAGWPVGNLLALLAMSGLGLWGLLVLRAAQSLPTLGLWGVFSLGALGCWRWSWFGLHLLRAQIYLWWQFPRWRRRTRQLPWQGLPTVAMVVPTYREEVWITERVFTALALEARQLPRPLTLVVATTVPEMAVIEEILRREDPELASVRLILLPQTGAGKRRALADGLRALSQYADLDLIPRPEVVGLMDGDSVLTGNTLLGCLSLFRLLPRVGAMTTDERPEVSGAGFYREWLQLRFAQRHLQMASQSLSQRLLCLTGRFSLFRADLALRPSFADLIEMDYIQDWLWGDFQFLSGDDKSTWFWLLQRGYPMLYIPDVQITTIETVTGNQWRRIYQNMRRWFGNMFRNGSRALALGPWRTGWFIWFCLIDQRLNCWTSLVTAGVLLILLIEGRGLAAGLVLCWLMFTRPLMLLLFAWGRPFQPKPIHVVQLLLGQWSSSLVKIYTQMHLAQQRWVNRGNQQAVGSGGRRWLKLGLARGLLLLQGFSFVIALLWLLQQVSPLQAIDHWWGQQRLGAALPSQPVQVIRASDWGVIANDDRDDAQPLQQLLNRLSHQLPATNLAQIVLPAGELQFQHPLRLQRSLTELVGAGVGRTVIQFGATGRIVISPAPHAGPSANSVADVALRNLTLIRPSGTALSIQQLERGELENLEFQGQGDGALVVKNSPELKLIALTGTTVAALPASPALTSTTPTPGCGQGQPLWQSRFDRQWSSGWGIQPRQAWGFKNVQVIPNPEFGQLLRVQYPQGSASPEAHRRQGAPLGGSQFLATLNLSPRETVCLSYRVRFAPNFDFVKGGKLPGLYGGRVISGGNIPDGSNGFSTRYMWRRGGEGEVYAYLPTSTDYGTSIGRGAWRFQPGIWTQLSQQVTLNTPGKADGRLRVWVDGKLVLEQQNLNFRSTRQLKIEGIFFSTFFGGSDSSWATPKSVYADFAEFQVFRSQ